jgi:LacI family transcriptional regulator
LIRSAGLPCVCIERPAAARFGFPAVTYDDAAGAYMATTHLLDTGHRRIAHLVGDLRYATAAARLAGYRRALAEAGIAVDESLICGGEWSTMLAAAETRRLLSLPDPPTAVFAASDDMAMGVLDTARDLGLSVPTDLAIVGFDDIALARDRTLPISTVRIPLEEIGRRAATLILANGDHKTGAPPEVLPVELIRRSSS